MHNNNPTRLTGKTGKTGKTGTIQLTGVSGLTGVHTVKGVRSVKLGSHQRVDCLRVPLQHLEHASLLIYGTRAHVHRAQEKNCNFYSLKPVDSENSLVKNLVFRCAI